MKTKKVVLSYQLSVALKLEKLAKTEILCMENLNEHSPSFSFSDLILKWMACWDLCNSTNHSLLLLLFGHCAFFWKDSFKKSFFGKTKLVLNSHKYFIKGWKIWIVKIDNVKLRWILRLSFSMEENQIKASSQNISRLTKIVKQGSLEQFLTILRKHIYKG